MKQLSLFNDWNPGSIRPAPGQEVLMVYEKEDGMPSDIIIGEPIHKDDTDYPSINGKPVYRPVLWWMELPNHPVTSQQKSK